MSNLKTILVFSSFKIVVSFQLQTVNCKLVRGNANALPPKVHDEVYHFRRFLCISTHQNNCEFQSSADDVPCCFASLRVKVSSTLKSSNSILVCS